ncbi:Putative O-methyltransferase/MSMEI_4947 [Pseudoclavibacter triregionum]|nr:Putative O-methyltransferase/MSMEI_4947 [Pseudoclavibacter triregionum]
MSDLERNARYLDERVEESEAQREARVLALELGLRPISPLAGAHLSTVTAAVRAGRILEIGGGIGTATLWLRRGAPSAELTVLEEQGEWSGIARRALLADGARPGALRFIAGSEAEVLARMSDAAYDLVVIADDAPRFPARLQHALRLAKPGGTILALGAMRGSMLANPARRDPLTAGMRLIIDELETHPDFVASVLPIERGILEIAKLR